MKCIECDGLGGHQTETIHDGMTYKQLKQCEACSGPGEVSAGVHRFQLAELTADDKNDELKLQEYEKANK